MKRINVIGKCLVLSLILLVLSACGMKTEYSMDINNNKSMEFSAIIGLDDKFIESLISLDGTCEEKEYSDDEKWKLIETMFESENAENNPEDMGFVKERYSDGTFMGLKFSKKIDNIDDISGSKVNFDLNDFANFADRIVFEKNGQVYRAKMKLEKSADIKNQPVDLEAKFVVTLPTKPISHNAQEVSNDGKTLTWNLIVDADNTIEFEFKFSMLWLYILIIILCVSGVSIIVYVYKKRQGPKPTANTVTLFDNTDSKNIINNISFEEIKNEEVKVEKPDVLTVTNLDNSAEILNPGIDVSTEGNSPSYESLDDQKVEELKDVVEDVNVADVFPGEPSSSSPTLKEFANIAFVNNNVESSTITKNESKKFENVSPTVKEFFDIANGTNAEVTTSRFFAPEDKPHSVVDESIITVESIFPTERADYKANFVDSTQAYNSVSVDSIFPETDSSKASNVDLEKTTFANNLTEELFEEIKKSTDNNQNNKFFN